MKLTYRFTRFLIMLLLLACFGCSSSSNCTDGLDSDKIGVFLDAPVVGLQYESTSYKGTTDENGKFKYRDGEKVKFFTGGIILGTTYGDDIITPFKLEDENGSRLSKTAAINVMRFLQSISSLSNDRLTIHANAVKNLAEESDVNFEKISEDRLKEIIKKVDESLSLVSQIEAKKHFNKSLESLAEQSNLRFAEDMLEGRSFTYVISETREKGIISFERNKTLIVNNEQEYTWLINENGKLKVTSIKDGDSDTLTIISNTDHITALMINDQSDNPAIIEFFDSSKLYFKEEMIAGKTFTYHRETTDKYGENMEKPETGFVTFNKSNTVFSEDENTSYEDTWSIIDGILYIEDEDGEKENYRLLSQKGLTIVAFINDGNTTTLTLKKVDTYPDRSKKARLNSGDFFRFNSEFLGGSSIVYDDIEGKMYLPHSMALPINESYENITQAPYGIYKDSNGNNPTVLPATPGKVYVFQAPDYSYNYTLPAYYKLEIISATIRPNIESPEIGEVKFKYSKIMKPDFVDAFGEWEFDEEAHLSIMGLDMIDYHPPGNTDTMFFFGRMSVTSKTTMQGTMEHFVGDELFEKTIKLSFIEKGTKMDVKIEGESPIQNTILKNGVKQSY